MHFPPIPNALPAQTDLEKLAAIILRKDSLFWKTYNDCDTQHQAGRKTNLILIHSKCFGLLILRYHFTCKIIPSIMRISTLLLFGIFFLSLAKSTAQDFRVQIAAYAEAMPDTFFHEKGVKNFIVSHDQLGLYRYFAGSYQTRDEAEKVQQDMVAKGFSFAAVIDLEEQRVLCGANCPYFRNGVIFMQDPKRESTVRNIYFDFGRYSLSLESKEELNVICQKLKENPTLKLKILGHTDAVGSPQANIQLATSRARSARNYLINKGIRADRMFIKVFGEAEPIAANSEELSEGKKEDLPENRKWNRRVVLAIIDDEGAVKTDDAVTGGGK